MKNLLEAIDKLEGYEMIQFFVAVIIAGLGLALLITVILHPEYAFEL